MNPLLPRKYFIPDVEAHVMPDGKLYLYGSADLSGVHDYCSHYHYVFSTDDPTLSEWTEHGVSFKNTTEEPGIPWKPGIKLYAPDAIHKNGRYYLYLCGADSFEAAAVSDKPEGPFTDAKPIAIADGDSIDPAIFVDDDGQAYYLWGQFTLRGAKLHEDMVTIDPDSVKRGILNEREHGFHEGASMRKRNGKYYIVYTDISRGKATCLGYAMSDNPLGPYTKGGIIIDNMYCDPQTWNNHGSIEEFNGQWYVFYHRASQNSNNSRRVCAEPITFNEDGTINEVIMTSQGASGPISAFSEIDASIACRMKGNVYIAPEGEKDGMPNEILMNCGGGSWDGDWAEYRYIDFGDGASSCTVRARGKGRIDVKVDGSDKPVCSFETDSDEFAELTSPVTVRTDGVRAVWFVFYGREMSVDSFVFGR